MPERALKSNPQRNSETDSLKQKPNRRQLYQQSKTIRVQKTIPHHLNNQNGKTNKEIMQGYVEENSKTADDIQNRPTDCASCIPQMQQTKNLGHRDTSFGKAELG
jgi:hypothetical protein